MLYHLSYLAQNPIFNRSCFSFKDWDERTGNPAWRCQQKKDGDEMEQKSFFAYNAPGFGNWGKVHLYVVVLPLLDSQQNQPYWTHIFSIQIANKICKTGL